MTMKEEFTAHDMATAAADGFRDGQRAAQSVGVPDGWALVPIKPTIEMVEAGFEEGMGKPDRSAYARVIEQFDAMLAAAPQPAAQQGDEVRRLREALEGMLEYFPEGASDGECFAVDAARAALPPAPGRR